MNNKKVLFLIEAVLGFVLLFIGFFVVNSEALKMLSGLCIGLGAALAALGTGQLLQALLIPAFEMERLKKQKEIEVNDERNIRIKEKTGYRVAKIMNYVLSLYILVLGFMGAGLPMILLAVSLLVIEFVLVIYFSNYYARSL
ncbi:MAG: hypothetical protein LWX83_08610 [Anaerolineae bacterium]|nr:hypothetical protein [Anaerolineae bacterium]